MRAPEGSRSGEDHDAARSGVKAKHESNGSLGALEFIDAKMYVGVEESDHLDAFTDLTDTHFVPRTNVEMVGYDGANSTVQSAGSCETRPGSGTPGTPPPGKRSRRRLTALPILALMPIDLRFCAEGRFKITPALRLGGVA